MENEITGILLFPSIKPSESLRGYMYRTAQVNAYPRLFQGVSKVFDSMEGFMRQVSRRDPSLKSALESRIAPSTTPTEVSAFHLRLGDEWIPEKYFLMRRRKVCPKCLKDHAWARGEWELKSLTACARHKVELVTECSNCHRGLAWINTDLLRCCCGHPLAFIETVSASVREVDWARLIEQATLSSIRCAASEFDLGGGRGQSQLSKLLLMAEILKSVILPKHLNSPASAHHQRKLVAEILEDANYRPHLWETVFLHAAADPFQFSKALRLGQDPNELADSFEGIVNDLMVPRSLKRLGGPMPVRPPIGLGRPDEWKSHLAKLKRFYNERVKEGCDPFSPLFPRGTGDAL